MILVREELIEELKDTRKKVEHAKEIASAPYSSHEWMQKYHYELGFQSGIARAIEIVDKVSGDYQWD